MFDLAPLFTTNTVTAVEYQPSDYDLLLSQLTSTYQQLFPQRPVLYWNQGFDTPVKLKLEPESNQAKFIRVEFKNFSQPLTLLRDTKLVSGLYIFDDLLDFDELSLQERKTRSAQIYNCINRIKFQPEVKVIFLTQWLQLPAKIRLATDSIRFGLPQEDKIAKFLAQKLNFTPESKLVSACAGLAWGNIHHQLECHQGLSIGKLTQEFLQIKQQKLEQSELNLEYFANPAIPNAGGNENLAEFIERISILNEPSARNYGIRPPKAMLYVGPPGTGKSLRAKMVARNLGYTLLGISFGDILGSKNPDRVVSQLLELAESIGKTVLFLDDWDKGLADWESGGPSRRIVQKFLTWMQEHESSVITIATVNRIELLPVELLRRFDDGGIWIIDLPNRGEIFAIFNIYLAKFFPTQFSFNPPSNVTWTKQQWLDLVGNTPWNMEQWVELIDEAEECTPAEIEIVTRDCLDDWYASLDPDQREQDLPSKIDFDFLLDNVRAIVKASVRASESIQAMRNNAWYAKAASKPDTSPFVLPEEVLLGGG